MGVQNMVKAFHCKFGVKINTSPIAQPEESKLRISLLKEEVKEYCEAVKAGSIVDVADALADIVYVAYGSALTHGINLDEVLREVHRSNMTKYKADESGKLIKGPDYSPPDLQPIVWRHTVMRVIDLNPGQLVEAHGMKGTFITRAPHPLNPGFMLVIWHLGKPQMEYSFDCLLPHQDVGGVDPSKNSPEQCQERLRHILRPGV